MLFKVFNTLFLAAFVLSAAVQFNDPDSLPWIVIYLAAAAMCAAQFTAVRSRWPAVVLLVASLVWSVALLPRIIGEVTPSEIVESISMQTRAVEEAREIGGLWLITVWSAVLVWRGRRQLWRKSRKL